VLALERGDRAALLATYADYGRASRASLFTKYGFYTSQACVALLEGRFADAEARAAEAFLLGRRIYLVNAEGSFGLQMFTLRREQGRLDEARPALERFVQTRTSASTWRPGLALLYAELGLDEKAREVFEEITAAGFASIARDFLWAGSISYLVEVCVRLGDRRRAEELAELFAPFRHWTVVAGGNVICLGSAARYLGLLSATLRRWPEAEGLFRDALEANEKLGALPALVRTRLDYGEMLLARRRGDDVLRARTLLDRAAADARSLGMGGVSGRLERLLEAARDYASRKVTYPDGLSPREVDVVRLIALGRTNLEIASDLYISEKTVDHHVSSILAKTGCANRAEAASYAARHGL
jgi:DNA-binding CsgD family transcriptional regulator